MQQGVLALLKQGFRTDDNARNFVRFERQEPNQVLAKVGSLTGELATLDLSEASDRVSNQHVRALLARHPLLAEAVDATRSRKADLPVSGQLKTVRLAKFASMGSALCFPFEALVFTTVVFLGIERQLNRPLTDKDVKSMYGKVRVYGDDIVVPVEYVTSVVRELEAFGFRVNAHKSFWTGKFRESCGRDYYDGRDVSIVRVRSLLPSNRRDVEQIVSTVSLRNQLFHAGLETATDYLDRLVEGIIPFPQVHWAYAKDLPLEPPNGDSSRQTTFAAHNGLRVIQSSPVLGRHEWGPSQATHHDPHLHRPLVRGAVIEAKSPINSIDDYGALMKWFLIRGEHPVEDKDHLQRSGRPDSVRIKIRKGPYR